MAAFFDRTNAAGGGAYFDRSNSAVGNSGAATLPATATAASGVTYQVVTATAAITTNPSAFYDVGFTVVNGQSRVALPTVWQGSTITLSANGSYVISPALPSGTVIPRRAFNQNTGLWLDDTITLLAGAGTGVATLQGISCSGVGTLSSNRGVRRSLVNKVGAPIAQGTQIRAVIQSNFTETAVVYFNGVVTVGAGGVLSVSSDSLPAIGTFVAMYCYQQGAGGTGDDDQGMAPRRVQVINLNT